MSSSNQNLRPTHHWGTDAHSSRHISGRSQNRIKDYVARARERLIAKGRCGNWKDHPLCARASSNMTHSRRPSWGLPYFCRWTFVQVWRGLEVSDRYYFSYLLWANIDFLCALIHAPRHVQRVGKLAVYSMRVANMWDWWAHTKRSVQKNRTVNRCHSTVLSLFIACKGIIVHIGCVYYLREGFISFNASIGQNSRVGSIRYIMHVWQDLWTHP